LVDGLGERKVRGQERRELQKAPYATSALLPCPASRQIFGYTELRTFLLCQRSDNGLENNVAGGCWIQQRPISPRLKLIILSLLSKRPPTRRIGAYYLHSLCDATRSSRDRHPSRTAGSCCLPTSQTLRRIATRTSSTRISSSTIRIHTSA
jgi:hypothetical protein